MTGLRHVRFSVGALRLDDDEVVIRYGDLLVTRNDPAPAIDWELVVMTVDPAPVDHGAHHLSLRTADDRALHGDAILVRSVDGTHVFRGASLLDGFDPTELD